ncbi:PP2C family protein-serine/threonine phosphatase [Nonomuraea roseoviolacea]|uniref:Serine phosphatase RsbU (Regulator of sigma subunit) n=1 Tax=Nonomuraea roseoviolacea subsp. carminata TaxID=160689 RepID=A0ABT1K8Y8_9ACTN|nr:PP2C family protein-serine/threonine phosphatase [Nonomuraea roseoviolacea]MCP2350064.1 serine phosphatase RsbU (regulator of sigma subunit) [Nonomuraea roseoviolacea subsp. carminata]
MRDNGERMLGGLVAAHHLATLEELPWLVSRHAEHVGFSDVLLYVADLQQQYLVPLPGQRHEDGTPFERIRVDSTVAGRAFRMLDIVQTRPTSGPATDEPEAGQPPSAQEPRRMYLPLLDGTERLGVLAVTVPRDDERVRWRASQLAALTALILANKRSTSDTYARLVRAQPMQLSAEMLWRLLPVRTFATGRVVVTAALEPAYLAGGDAFDYAVGGDLLHLAVFDAMGHDTAAGLTATIAVGACRNTRREDVDLPGIGEAVDAAVFEQFGGTQFATGVLAALDLRTGVLRWVNRGHHPPLVLRHGRLVATLRTEPDPPMGFKLGAVRPPARYQLEPGDRLLFYTDGVIEARSPDGEVFGLERFVDFVIRREADGVPPPETLRRLIQTLLEHQQDRLQDDATVMLVEWRTQSEQRLVL